METTKKPEIGVRYKIFKYLRSENTIETITDRRGNEVALNLTKRIMLNKPYKNTEYEKERLRLIQKVNNKFKENQQEKE